MRRGDAVEAANQPQGNVLAPSVVDSDDGNGPERYESGAYGEFMRRAKLRPLSFTFAWRGSEFLGTVECFGDGMRMSLRSALAALPFSAENAADRGSLLAVVDTCANGSEAKLTVVQGSTIMLEHEITLPRSIGGTVTTMVTQLTMLVLNTAPYLDLIAKHTTAPAEA